MSLIDSGFGLNAFFDLYTGGQKRPVFFDIERAYPSLNQIARNYGSIRQELESILPFKKDIPRYHEIDKFEYNISGRVDSEKDWKVFMLYAMGGKPKANREKCPRTSAILDTIPNLFQAFFSILDAGKSIPAHNGPYRGYLRYHLALKVPKNDPPTIRIKDRYYTWKEGEAILFDDSWDHEVINKSDDIRVVLIVDVLRPMPKVPHTVNVAAQKLIRMVYGRQILKKLR